MGKRKKREVQIEKSEIEKIAEEIAQENGVVEAVKDIDVKELAEEIAQAEANIKVEETAEEESQEETSEETAEEESQEETSEETAEEESQEEKVEEVQAETLEEGEATKKKVWKTVGIVAAIVAGALLLLTVALYFVGVFHFSERFLIGTTVNGVDCAGQTVEEVRKTLQKEVEEYKLIIETKNDGQETIKGTDIDIKYNGVNVIENAMKKQNPYLWFKGLYNEKDIKANIDFDYDKGKLDELVVQLNCMKAENQIAPISAVPVYLEGKYQIQEESYGSQINQEKLYAEIYSSVDEMKKTLNLEEKECYVLPAYKKDSQEVIDANNALNQCLKASVTYSLDGIVVSIDATTIAKWISVDPNTMAVNVDANQVRAFTDSLGAKYNTPNGSEQITTPTGRVTSVPNGRLGRIVGSAAECDQLINEIRQGKVITREPLLSQKPSSETAVAWGTTYVEVDITAQHMWYIVNGAVAFESDIVTGSPGRDTPVGVFTILEKLRNKTLTGNIVPATGKPEYVTPVSYWARVTWSGIGFHDATWQPAFGGQRYRQGYGSHGCINMPLNAVASFYEMVSVGCPVLIHY